MQDTSNKYVTYSLIAFIFFIGAIFPYGGFAQNIAKLGSKTGNQRCKFVYKKTAQSLDSFLIAPNSVFFPASEPNSAFPFFDYQTQSLYWPDSIAIDSIQICYTIVPELKKVTYLRNLESYEGLRFYMDQPEVIAPTLTSQELFSTPKLNKSGSITRGISFGNTQNAFVNSQLNLQMQGMLSDDIKLTAVINDQQVPYQPEGNTQNIREFDRVYIQLEHKKANLIAGDVVLASAPESHFLRYYKNIQGGSFQINWADSANPSQTFVSAGVAKGKFASIVITPLDGVQGPYRLQVPDAEGFIMINANTERVYIDGQLLKRGFNLDYIIDYNQGEIIFNNTIVITRYSRIRVDFEYVTREYNRSLYNFGHTHQYRSGKVKIEHYQEQDNENRPTGFTPNTTLINELQQIGQANVALVSGALQVNTFNPDQVLYTKVPSPDVIGDSIYQLITSATALMYTVSFTQVQNGDYNLNTGSNNGRVYTYVGKGRGSYLPLRRLALPNRKTLTQLSWQQSINKNQQLITHLAYSNQNSNLYSKLPAAQQTGYAINTQYIWKEQALVKNYKWKANLQYEQLSKDFKAIDRFRSIEFEREWNGRSGDSLPATDHLITLQTQIAESTNRNLQTTLKRRSKGDNVDGFITESKLLYTKGFLQLNGNQYFMQNKTSLQTANWNRYTGGVTLNTKIVKPQYEYTTERSQVSAGKTDSIISTANNYFSHSVFVTNPDSAKQTFKLGYTQRTDKLPLEGKLVNASTAHNYTAETVLPGKADRQLSMLISYRNLQSLNPELNLVNASEQEAIQGRLNWQGTYLNQCLRNELTYILNNGRELQREYRFVKAPILGEGTHFYLSDLNGNGLQDLDEFVIATRPEQREYIKIFVATNTYIQAFSNQLVYRINLQTPQSWKQKKGLLKVMSKLSNISSIQAEQRSTSSDLSERLNPLANTKAEALLSQIRNLKSNLFYDRSNPDFALELGVNQNINKQLNTNGFETRRNTEWRFSARKNIGYYHNVQLNTTTGNRIAESDFLDNRNFNINQYVVSPEWSFQPNTKIRYSFTLSQSWKRNLASVETAQIRKIGTEVRWNKKVGSNLNATLQYTSIVFKGSELSQVAYEMNEGLANGNNLTWNLNWQQKLTEGLQLILNYDGRQSPNSPAVHIGRVQVTALF